MYYATFGAENDWYQIFEVFYLLDLILNFFVEYKEEDETRVVREFHLTMINYIKNDFLIDLLPILPLEYLNLGGNMARHFFLIKVTRIRKGYQLISIKDIINEVKSYYQAENQKLIDSKSKLAENTLMDLNKVERIILIHHILKSMKLVILILNFSYFLSLSWLIVCIIVDDIYLHLEIGDQDH